MANDVVIHVRAKDDASRVVVGSSAKMGDSLKKMGGLAVVAGGLLAGALAKGAYKAVMAASDMNETVNKSSVIFGKNQKDIAAWASGAAKNLGLSQQQAMESAASFGDMFLQLGFAGNASAKMSKSVVQLAADLGSFNNLPTADVQERIAAAFRGEYDSLQALVPTINAAKVEQVAMAMTGKKNADALTQQEKAAAVLKIVTDSTKRAQGDFAKTSDGLANSLKIARARLDDMAASAGKALLPFAQAGMKGFLHFLDRLEGSKSLKKSLRGLADSLGEFVTSGDSATETADNLADSFIDMADGADKGFKKFNKANSRFKGFITGQEVMIREWRVKMLSGILDVVSAWAKINPRMKAVEKWIRGSLGRAQDELDETRRKSKQLNDQKVETKLKADKKDAQNKIKDINRQLTKTHNKKTESKLRAQKEQAQQAIRNINAQLDRLNGKTATTKIKTVHIAVYGKETTRKTASGGIIGGIGINAHAAEGGPRGAQVLVGESGPEIVDLPMGSHVNSNPDSQRMMANRGGRGGINIYVNAPNYVGAPSDLLRALVDAKRRGQLDVILR